MSDFRTQPPPIAAIGTNPLAQLHTDLVEMTKAMNRLTQQVAASFPQFVSPPVTTASPGSAGQFAYDSTYLYVCVGTSDWGRILLDKAF